MNKWKWAISILLLILLVIGALFYHFFYAMYNLPEGKLIHTVASPDKKYSVNAYIVEGGATVPDSIRAEVVTNSSGKKTNIYWDSKMVTVSINWVDNKTVIINGHELDVTKDVYDWRR
ncbi:DUF5412 family protein [Brevibacillus halotolerans]|uniref:DUF5412 family protein n=1 Tax=Brevibacillus halotolerans TaxID=1507437 RepID=UPI0015EE7490|nr:hypothetical protein [Brevibacillus halotolerans]